MGEVMVETCLPKLTTDKPFLLFHMPPQTPPREINCPRPTGWDIDDLGERASRDRGLPSPREPSREERADGTLPWSSERYIDSMGTRHKDDTPLTQIGLRKGLSFVEWGVISSSYFGPLCALMVRWRT